MTAADTALKASLILMMALAAMPFLRRQSASLRHRVLTAAFVSVLAVPAAREIAPRWQLPVALPRASMAVLPFKGPANATAAPAGSAVASGPASADSSPAGATVIWILASIWGLGTAAGLTALGAALLRLRRLSQQAGVNVDGRWVDAAAGLSRRLGLRREAVLLQGLDDSLLVTWGFLRPRILLPRSARDWDDSRMRMVLCHELAHIRRSDWIVQLGSELLRACYWFNPLVWMACARLRRESEHACDDEVINSGIEGSEYAAHLVEIARTLAPAAHRVPAEAIARPSTLERRVRAMLEVDMNRRPITRTASGATLAALLAATLLVAGIAAAQNVFATFTGSIVDPQSAALPDATLVLTNVESSASYSVRSDRTGRFEFVGLPAGTYALEVGLPGFSTLRGRVTVTGQSVQKDFALEIGTLQETITVADGRDREPAAPPAPSKPGTAFRPDPICRPGGSGDTRIGGNIRPPRKVKDSWPRYPQNLLGTGTEGTVTLRAVIGTTGLVDEVSVVSATDSAFASAASDAVRQWEFTPTLLNCVAVPVTMVVNARFEHRQ